MKLYTDRPKLYGAVQLCWKNWSELCEMLPPEVFKLKQYTAYEVDTYTDACGESFPYIEMQIPSGGQLLTVQHGDFLVRDSKGQLSCYSPDTFKEEFFATGQTEETGTDPG